MAPGTKPAGARLSTTEAIDIAKRTAERKGVDLRDFHEPEAHYEFVFKNKTWFVSFQGLVPAIGNHFSVYVNDRTREAEFIPGI